MSATDGMRKAREMDIFNADCTNDVEKGTEDLLTEMEGMPEEQNNISKIAPDPSATNTIPKEKVDKMAEMAAEMAETVVRMADAVAKVKEENGTDKMELLESKKKAQRRTSDEGLNEEDTGKIKHMAKMAEEMDQMNRMMSQIAAKIEETDNVQSAQRDEYPLEELDDDINDSELFEENVDDPENNNLSNVDRMLLDVRKAFEDSMEEFQASNVAMQISEDAFAEQQIGDEEEPSHEFVSNTDLADSIAELAKVLTREKEARDNLSRFKDDSASKAVSNSLKEMKTTTYADELSLDAIETDATTDAVEDLEGNPIITKDWEMEEEEEGASAVETGIEDEAECVVINHEAATGGEEEIASVWGSSLEGKGDGVAGAAASPAWALRHEAGAERSHERRRVVSLPSEAAPEPANPLGSPSLGRKNSITMPPPSETGNLVMTYVILLVLLIALWILYSGLV